MLEHYFAVIMAGGGGTRMWPLSRQSQPKQMLRLFDDRTLFQVSVERLAGMFPPDRILVVTVADQADRLQELTPSIPRENFLIEPYPRGTASVVGLAAVTLSHRDPDAVMAIVTSDHMIGNEKLFLHLLSAAYEVAQDDYLVTLGITPKYPSTGYGYIQMGPLLAAYQGLQAFQVLRFREKPDGETAIAFLASGDHAWNSGMFVWRTDQILDEFERQMPALSAGLNEIKKVCGTTRAPSTLERVWTGLKSETIDYGIMEGANRTVVLPAQGLAWNDVGTWDSMFEILPVDPHGNIFQGQDSYLSETENTLILDSTNEKLVVGIGIRDLVVVDTADVLLVCHRDHVQKVKEVVSKLRQTQREHYL
jgi:mannose-1-phosphate guanylyltransferase